VEHPSQSIAQFVAATHGALHELEGKWGIRFEFGPRIFKGAFDVSDGAILRGHIDDGAPDGRQSIRRREDRASAR
jgi:hypothetical protein